MAKQRLQRALARAGVASRRAAEELIRSGVVRVNGEVAELGVSVDPDVDRITVDGRLIEAVPVVWLALHKPEGYVVSRSDEKGRRDVFELVPELPGLTYVGRLDIMTSGLLLLTSDGAAVHRLTHPSFQVPRKYRVVARGRNQDEIEVLLAAGVEVDGRPVAVRSWSCRAQRGGRVVIELVLTEGRYRIVRRLCDGLGLTVLKLTRLSHGPIGLGGLNPGEWRYLEEREIAALGGGYTAAD